jgi:hypothetical protein
MAGRSEICRISHSTRQDLQYRVEMLTAPELRRGILLVSILEYDGTGRSPTRVRITRGRDKRPHGEPVTASWLEATFPSSPRWRTYRQSSVVSGAMLSMIFLDGRMGIGMLKNTPPVAVAIAFFAEPPRYVPADCFFHFGTTLRQIVVLSWLRSMHVRFERFPIGPHWVSAYPPVV